MSTPHRRPWRRRFGLFLLGAAVWTLFATYPNPLVLVSNLGRYHHLPLDPKIEQKMGWDLPNDPATIELFVDSLILDTPDWPTYRVPWYVPTADEAARSVHGDCESKTMLLASLLDGKGIPHEIRASFNHIWVDYANRPETRGESRDIAYLQGEPGRFRIRWPDRVAWGDFYAVQKQQLWEAMPPARKAIWLIGLGWVALGAVLIGGRPPTGDLMSRWQVHPVSYLGRSAWLAFAALAAIALAPSFRADTIPARWTIFDLREVFALSLVLGGFLAWLSVIRPREAVSLAADGSQLQGHSALGLWRRDRALDAARVDHLELASSAGALNPWVVSAALRTGQRIPLLTYDAEVTARSAVRQIASSLDRPWVVRARGVEKWTAPDEIGLNVKERTAQRPQSTPSARPEDLHLTIEEAEGRWAIGYPRGVARPLLVAAGTVAGATMAATAVLLFFPASFGAWLLWATAAVLLGMTAYGAMSLREEILSWLGGAHLEVGEGEVSFHGSDGKVESVPVDDIESVELARRDGQATVAVIAPERVIHMPLYCAPKHREWVREAIERAIAQA